MIILTCYNALTSLKDGSVTFVILSDTDVFCCMTHLFSCLYFLSLSFHTQTDKTSQELKKEVEYHLKEKESLEHSLPPSIVIGPFIVRVEPVRQALTNKRKALANALLAHFARKLRKQVDDVSHLF